MSEVIDLYLNGSWPMSTQEWWQLGGHRRFVNDKILKAMQAESVKERLRDKRMSDEMHREAIQ